MSVGGVRGGQRRPTGGHGGRARQQPPHVLSNLQSLLLHTAPTLPQYSSQVGAARCAYLRPNARAGRSSYNALPLPLCVQWDDSENPCSATPSFFTLRDLW